MSIKYKTISANESQFLKKLDDEGRSWAYISDLYEMFPQQSKESVRVTVKRMVDKGLLAKFGKDLVWVVPFNMEADTFLPDWHLMAEPLAGGNKYYIGYYSALQIHGLITQPSLKEQIVCKDHKAVTLKFQGVDFQIIKHSDEHFFGTKKMWIDSYNKVVCSDLEKTIIDCLFMPNYAGGIVEIAKAMWTAKDKIDMKKLLSYAERFSSQAVIKRLGYLLEYLGMGEDIVPALLSMRSSSISPLDLEVPNIGKITTRWNLRINVDMETVSNALIN